MIAEVIDRPIDRSVLIEAVTDDRAGALVTFAGIVRNHDHGRAVVGIEYTCHPSASQILAETVAEFARREGVHHIAAQHRVGELVVGDDALVVAVTASHRREAFETCADLVDRLKEVLPIWKKQHFPDGTFEWSNCP